MSKGERYDAVVVGSGPNGLAAAITMARAGCTVLVLEANGEIGGGIRSAELTLPGFTHDLCSSIYPLGPGSPFLQQLPLGKHGLEWIHAPIPLAHPLDGGRAAVLQQSLAATADALKEDAATYLRLMRPFVERWEDLAREFLQPLRRQWPPRGPLPCGQTARLSTATAAYSRAQHD
jgi:phytoene dehydrogenase-like protein